MYIQQLYTNCLSEAAYYIESNGEAAIIDPIRDIDGYLQLAKERKATIKYIFETHFHADFVSGHLDLSKATNAPIVYGPNTTASFPFILATDGQVFSIGNITITALHTPGHTLESTCYLLKDDAKNSKAIFTGDTLFVGDVGRPDLAQKTNELSMEDLAGMLYDSLQQHIHPLANDIIVYPAHGPGSSCGKNLGPNTFSTIGEEKATNYALQPQTKEVFIKAVTEGLTAPPAYFPINVQINKQGYEPIDAIITAGTNMLSINNFKEYLRQDDTILIDTRNAQLFMEGFVPTAISIGLEGRFAEWAGNMVSFTHNILLVTEVGKEAESVTRLARVGFSKFLGCLQGGFQAWKAANEPIDMIINIEADEFAMDIPFDDRMVIIDVRKETEFAHGHVKAALNMPLESLTDPGTLADIDDEHNVYLHCAGGYRSVIAASIFKKQGLHNVRNIEGGWGKIKEVEKIPIEQETAALN